MALEILSDLLNGLARAGGAYAQIMSGPRADANYLYDPTSVRILNESQYMGYKTMAADAEYARRIRYVREYAKRYNVPAELIDAFQPFIKIMLKSDSPQLRQKIREWQPPFGGILLDAFDAATDKEVGDDRLYPGYANTFGSPAGNSLSARAASYTSSLVRDESNLTEDGHGRKYTAGMIAATLALKQERGFSFEMELGAENIKDYGEIFSKNITGNDKALKAAQLSYIDTKLQDTLSKTDKDILTQMKKNIISGSNVYADLDKYVGANKEYKDIDAITKKFDIDDNSIKNAQVNQAAVIRDTLVRELKKDGAVKDAFEKFARDNGLTEFGPNATAEEKRAKSILTNKFIDQVITGKIAAEDLGESESAQLLQTIAASDKELGKTDKVIKGLARRIAEESRLRQAVGQAAWQSLSTEEQQKYVDLYGDVATAQVHLGSQSMDKLAHAYMRDGRIAEAANITQQIYAAQKRAGFSDESLTKQYAFIGSIMRNKDLTDTVAQASFAWQASARKQGIELSEEQRLGMGQRFERMAESVQGNAVSMFLTQRLDPNSKLGKLQKALRSGTLTPEQRKQFQEYMDDQAKFKQDIAKATHKTTATLEEEARHSKTNWDGMLGFERANVLNEMNRAASATYIESLVTEDRIAEHFRGLNRDELKAMGAIGSGVEGVGEKKFQKMLLDVTKSGLVDPTKWVTGELSKSDIDRLVEAGLTDAVAFAKQRRKDFRKKARDYRDKEGFAEGEAINQARIDQGGTEITRMYDKFLGNHEAVINLGLRGVDATKTGVINETAEDARYNEKKASAKKLTSQMTVEEWVADKLQKDPTGLRDTNNSGMSIVKSIWDGLFNRGGADKKEQNNNAPDKSATDTGKASAQNDEKRFIDTFIALCDKPQFASSFGKALGDSCGEALKTVFGV